MKNENKKHIISPKVMKLIGTFKLPKDFNYKTELTEAISKK